MGATLLDNLLAIVVGTVLLIALVVLQLRQRSAAVDETIHHAVRGYVQEAMDVVTADVDNMLSPSRAATLFENGSLTLVDTAATDPSVTRLFYFPTQVPDISAAPLPSGQQPLIPVQVGYRAVPTGQTVRVGETLRSVYRLERAQLHADSVASVSTSNVGAAGTTASVVPVAPATFAFQQVSAGMLLEFRAELFGLASDTAVVEGGAPLGLQAIRIGMAGGLPKLDSLAGGVVNTRQLNATRTSVTRRPVNL